MKKNADRLLTAIYCDDIRNEVGNKMSFMGVYQGELLVPVMPTLLPKLCIFISAWTLKEHPFKSLVIRAVLGDDSELARIEVPSEGFALATVVPDETTTRLMVGTSLVFSPFFIEKETTLRLLATSEEGEIIGPRLRIKMAPNLGASEMAGEMPKDIPNQVSVKKRATKKSHSAA